jgi:predicted transcriptional regulator
LKIRLGILGGEESVNVILGIVANYPSFNCIPLINGDREKVIPILQEYDKKVDMWLFPGRIAYVIAKEWGGVSRPIFNIPYKGSSLYRTLCEIFYSQKLRIDEISFDSVLNKDIQQTCDELGILEKPAYIKPFELGQTEEECVEFHYQLWKNGSTKAAITGAGNVKKRLQQLGVPVLKILPARADVEAALTMMMRVSEMQFVRDAQIAVQMLELDTFTSAKEFFSADEMYSGEIEIRQKLISYAKRVHGSLKAAGPDRFVIFTTRGMLRTVTDDFSAIPIIEEFEQIGQSLVTCGIGIGMSAYEAEFHAAKALLHAKEYGKGSWMVFFDDKTAVGPLGREQQISYCYSSESLQSVSELTKISISTLSKIIAIMRKIRSPEISAQELASHLQILPRSARRIIAKLEQNGFAQAVGEESPNPRGRPRTLYRINLGQE